MSGIRVYFMEIIDLNGGKHQIKSTDYQKIWDFVKRHKGEIKACIQEVKRFQKRNLRK